MILPDFTPIVSGFVRTGTSAMMRACMKSGMIAEVDIERDNMNLRYGDSFYKPNPDGFFELSSFKYHEVGFPNKYKGKLIKVLRQGILKIVAGKYKIVYMLRDPEEIKQSYYGFFGRRLNIENKTFNKRTNDVIDILKQRRDIEIEVFHYRELVEDPKGHFQRLVDLGWPINVYKSASIINKKKYRYRKENLEIGIAD